MTTAQVNFSIFLSFLITSSYARAHLILEYYVVCYGLWSCVYSLMAILLNIYTKKRLIMLFLSSEIDVSICQHFYTFLLYNLSLFLHLYLMSEIKFAT